MTITGSILTYGAVIFFFAAEYTYHQINYMDI